jgi:hypothetical protein
LARLAPCVGGIRKMRTVVEGPFLRPVFAWRFVDGAIAILGTSRALPRDERQPPVQARETPGTTMTYPSSKPPLASVRNQAALVRALLDELEALTPRFDPARPPSAQAIDELTRLGCRIFEAAAILSLEEEAQRVPRLTKCLPAQVEADPIGVESTNHVHAAADSGQG